MTDSTVPPPPPPPPPPSDPEPTGSPSGPSPSVPGGRRVPLATALWVVAASIAAVALVLWITADDGPSIDATGTASTAAVTTPQGGTTVPGATTSPGVTTGPAVTTAPAPPTTASPTTTAASTVTDGASGGRLLQPTDVGLESTYEVSSDAYGGSQTTVDGDYPIDCGSTYGSEAFEPQSREATTWRGDSGNWFEVVDVFPSSAESSSVIAAVLDQLIQCTESGDVIRPLTWFEGVVSPNMAPNFGGETWSGESLLGSGPSADHTIFSVTRIDNVIIYTQLYSFGGEIVDRGVAWDLADRAVARATG